MPAGSRTAMVCCIEFIFSRKTFKYLTFLIICISCAGVHITKGLKYRGTFVDGIKEGRGVCEHPDGSHYEGQMTNGEITGIGTMTFASGDVYKGEFLNEVMHGYGVYKYDRETQSYEGQFQHGRTNGRGTVHLGMGIRFEGYFVDGKRCGLGLLIRADNDKEIHEYKDDALLRSWTGSSIVLGSYASFTLFLQTRTILQSLSGSLPQVR